MRLSNSSDRSSKYSPSAAGVNRSSKSVPFSKASLCEVCYTRLSLKPTTKVGPGGGHLCDNCQDDEELNPRTQRESSTVVTPTANRPRRKRVSNQTAKNILPLRSHAESESPRGAHADTQALSGGRGSDDTSLLTDYEYFSRLSPSPDTIDSVAMAHADQPALFTSTTSETSIPNPAAGPSPPLQYRSAKSQYDIMATSSPPRSRPLPASEKSRKREFPGTPEPTPKSKKQKTLQQAFATPDKADLVTISSPSPSFVAHPSSIPYTPPSEQRPLGLFGSQARKLARGKQESLQFNPNDLPPDQALPLYQEISRMVNSLPAQLEPVLAVTKRLSVVEEENRQLKARIETLETKAQLSSASLAAEMNVAVVEQPRANDELGSASNGPNIGSQPLSSEFSAITMSGGSQSNKGNDSSRHARDQARGGASSADQH